MTDVVQQTLAKIRRRELTLEALAADASLTHLTSNEAVVLAAIGQWEGRRQLQWADVSLKRSRTFMFQVLQRQPLALEFASEAVKSDQQLVLTAVQGDWHALHYASPAMRSDRAVVLAAARQSPLALQHAAEVLRGDSEFVFAAALTCTGVPLFFESVLCFASDAMRSNKVIMHEAVKQHGYGILAYASSDCRSDIQFMRDIILNHAPAALEFATEALRDDTGTVLAAVRQNPKLFALASDRIKRDRTAVLTAVLLDPELLLHVPLEWLSDAEVVLAVLRHRRAAALASASSHLLIHALNSNEALLSNAWAEMPDAFKNTFICSVHLLSGRSCRFVLQGHLRFKLREVLLAKACALLSLEVAEVVRRGELVKDNRPLPRDATLPALGLGTLHELQLVFGAT